jgi:hypothetical protein
VLLVRTYWILEAVLRKPPAVGGPVRFVPAIVTILAVNGDAGAHAAWKFGSVGPVRV